MTKWQVTFYLKDDRGESSQLLGNKHDAEKFAEWCKKNPELVDSVELTEVNDENDKRT